MKRVSIIFTGLIITLSIVLISFGVGEMITKNRELNKSNKITIGIVTNIYSPTNTKLGTKMNVGYFVDNTYFNQDMPKKDFVGPNQKFVRIRYATSNPNNIQILGLSKECYFHNKISVQGKLVSAKNKPSISLINSKSDSDKLNLINDNYLCQLEINNEYTMKATAEGCKAKVVLISTINYKFAPEIGFELCHVNINLEEGEGVDTVGVLKYSSSTGGMVAEKYQR